MADVTIKDVARHAGVSIATVSRVINQNYYVSPDVEEKVLRSIKELNYYPNSVARSLKSVSTYTIGFLVSDISNNYFTSVAKAVEDVVNRENYNIIVCSTDDKKDQELAYLKLLMGKKIDGLIINTTGQNDDFIASISRDIPIVLINRRIGSSKFLGDFIDSDNIQGAYRLTSHLLSLGHKKIGIINGGLAVSTGKERYEGFGKAMREAGIDVDDGYPYRFDGDFTMDSGYQGASVMWAMPDRPTAIVVMNNGMALGALKFFRTHGIKVPEEISVASYGNIDNIELMYVRPSIVTLDPRAIGTKAGQLILERIKSHSIANREIIYAPELVAGDGVGKRQTGDSLT